MHWAHCAARLWPVTCFALHAALPTPSPTGGRAVHGLTQSESGVQRACRRHGIQRWPRRQLVKLSRAIDQINASGAPALAGITADLQPQGGVVGAAAEPQTPLSPESPRLLLHYD